MTTLAELKRAHRRRMDSGTTEEITLSLPSDTQLGVPADPGRWERRDGRIVVIYERDELTWAVALALSTELVKLQGRLERGLEVLEDATGCADAEADRLLSHWEALDKDYRRLSAYLVAVSAHLGCTGGSDEYHN